MMIFPDDYKEVGVTQNDPTLKPLSDEPIYFSTKYLIVCLGNENYKVLRVISEAANSLLTRVTSFEMIAREDEIIPYELEMDAHDRTKLIELALKKIGGPVNTVIFEGKDKHLTFVHKPDMSNIIDIQVIDVIPPDPPWLSFAIHRLVESGLLGELNIRFEHTYIDIKQFEGDDTVFPCYSSGLKGKYLDTDYDIKDNSLLVGCDISKEIFKLRFPEYTFRHINMCPLKTTIIKPSKPFITRCCQKERSGLINLNGYEGIVVHWGVSEYEIVDGIRLLVTRLTSGSGEKDEKGEKGEEE
jgi:hypothetical protein